MNEVLKHCVNCGEMTPQQQETTWTRCQVCWTTNENSADHAAVDLTPAFEAAFWKRKYMDLAQPWNGVPGNGAITISVGYPAQVPGWTVLQTPMPKAERKMI